MPIYIYQPFNLYGCASVCFVIFFLLEINILIKKNCNSKYVLKNKNNLKKLILLLMAAVTDFLIVMAHAR